LCVVYAWCVCEEGWKGVRENEDGDNSLPDCARTDKEVLLLHDALVEAQAEACDLAIVTRSLELKLTRWQLLVGKNLCAVEHKPLTNWRELARACLEHLLRSNTSKDSRLHHKLEGIWFRVQELAPAQGGWSRNFCASGISWANGSMLSRVSSRRQFCLDFPKGTNQVEEEGVGKGKNGTQ